MEQHSLGRVFLLGQGGWMAMEQRRDSIGGQYTVTSDKAFDERRKEDKQKKDVIISRVASIRTLEDLNYYYEGGQK